jgi:hypothetical protein
VRAAVHGARLRGAPVRMHRERPAGRRRYLPDLDVGLTATPEPSGANRP